MLRNRRSSEGSSAAGNLSSTRKFFMTRSNLLSLRCTQMEGMVRKCNAEGVTSANKESRRKTKVLNCLP